MSPLPAKSAIVYACFSECGDADKSKAAERFSAAYIAAYALFLNLYLHT